MERTNRKSDEFISKSDLIDYLIRMRSDTIVLTEDSLKKLAGLRFNNPIELVQFVFYKGFNSAVSHLLEILGK